MQEQLLENSVDSRHQDSDGSKHFKKIKVVLLKIQIILNELAKLLNGKNPAIDPTIEYDIDDEESITALKVTHPTLAGNNELTAIRIKLYLMQYLRHLCLLTRLRSKLKNKLEPFMRLDQVELMIAIIDLFQQYSDTDSKLAQFVFNASSCLHALTHPYGHYDQVDQRKRAMFNEKLVNHFTLSIKKGFFQNEAKLILIPYHNWNLFRRISYAIYDCYCYINDALCQINLSDGDLRKIQTAIMNYAQQLSRLKIIYDDINSIELLPQVILDLTDHSRWHYQFHQLQMIFEIYQCIDPNPANNQPWQNEILKNTQVLIQLLKPSPAATLVHDQDQLKMAIYLDHYLKLVSSSCSQIDLYLETLSTAPSQLRVYCLANLKKEVDHLGKILHRLNKGNVQLTINLKHLTLLNAISLNDISDEKFRPAIQTILELTNNISKEDLKISQ